MENTQTLEPIQLTIINDQWADFSYDDEYNMKNYGISDPKDLPKLYKGISKDGQIEMQSQNEQEAEIKASANLDTLKKIYSNKKSQ